MTPTLQAHQIYNYFFLKESFSGSQARLCAKYVVTQIINANPHSNPLNSDGTSTIDYWLEVKKEIDKM